MSLDLRAVASGLHALGVAFNREISKDLTRVYHAVLKDLTTEDLLRATKLALEHEQFFPPPSVLLSYAKAQRPSLEAALVYDAIANLGDDRKWNYRYIQERYGSVAGAAFLEAGGHQAFAWCELRDEPFRRKRFIEAWTELAQDSRLLLEEKKQPALPDGRL